MAKIHKLTKMDTVNKIGRNNILSIRYFETTMWVGQRDGKKYSRKAFIKKKKESLY